MSRRRIAIVQPYVLGYRVPFFTRLAAELAARNIDLTVAHGRPAGHLIRRSDADGVPGGHALRQRVLSVGRRQMYWRDLGELTRSHDALILEQALRNLEAYRPLLRRGGPLVGLWGHGGTYAVRHRAPLRAAKDALTRRADWFFAYTPAGGERAAAAGVPPRRITVVRNSIDTASLVAARQRLTPGEVERFRERHGLVVGRTAVFIGALDGSKRIPFLLDAARLAAQRLPGFRLLVAGDGTDQARVADAARITGAVRCIGTVDAAGKALLGAVGDVMLMPGLVGLCAVDSLALGTPMVTTDWPFHSPEFEYLADGRNAVVTADDLESYTDAVVAVLSDPRRLAGLRRACLEDARHYTVEGMAERFAAGVEGMLST